MDSYLRNQAALFHEPSFTNFSATFWCHQVMAKIGLMWQDLDLTYDRSSPPIVSKEIPEVESTFVRGCFEVNHRLIGFLIQRDVDAGLAFKSVERNRVTSTQIANICYRQKIRRRKQLFLERIGKVRVSLF
jgi:hypothetical protein